MIDKETIDKIYSAAEISEVIQEFVTLKKRGVNLLGLCPFHNEKTPSFTVSPAKGIYKCFGCGKGGNVVNFIMEHEQLSYYEALKFLAKKYHIEVIEKELTEEEKQQKTEKESLLIITSYAQNYFTKNLNESIEGMNIGMSYFRERKYHDNTIQKFELGYSLNKRDAFLNVALKDGFKRDLVVKTGLVIERGDDYYDRFRERVMFPIHNLMGRVIGFGGRILKSDAKTAKYLNSPESEIYHKSQVLYGLFQAKKAIVKNDKCFLVEGYTDVLSLHQSGMDVVASSGTALTTDQIRLIKRFTKNLTIIFDGDEAGIKASLRGIDMVLEQGMNVKIVMLPEGEDPDSFSKCRSATEFLEFLAQAEDDFVKFKTGLLIEDSRNDPVKMANLINDIVRTISVIPDTITRSIYIKECSSLLRLQEKVLYNEVNKRRRKDFQAKASRQFVQVTEPATKQQQIIKTEEDDNLLLEREIIRLLLNYGESELYVVEQDYEQIPVSVSQYIINEIEKDELVFSNPVYNKIADFYKEQLQEDMAIDHKSFIFHEDEDIARECANLLSQPYGLSKIWERRESYVVTEEMKLKELVPETLISYKYGKIRKALQEVQEQLKKAYETKNEEKVAELQKRFIQLTQYKMLFAKNLGERTII